MMDRRRMAKGCGVTVLVIFFAVLAGGALWWWYLRADSAAIAREMAAKGYPETVEGIYEIDNGKV